MGDVILTSPTVRALHDQGHEVHFLVKEVYKDLVLPNPHITKVWTLQEELSALLPTLKAEAFDVIIDLHSNLRSLQVKRALKVQTLSYDKKRLSTWAMTRLKYKTQKPLVAEQFLQVISSMAPDDVSPIPEYYFDREPASLVEDLDLPSSYYCIAVGAAWATKRIPTHKIKAVLDEMEESPVILLGGPGEEALSAHLAPRAEVIDLVAKLSIPQTAAVISRARALLTGDTGLMHVAAALRIPVVAVYGSTHPSLGYLPHHENHELYKIIQHDALSCRPCTKHGLEACPKGHYKCMEDLDPDDISRSLKGFF